MARIDDFFMARAISKKELADKDIYRIARFSGASLGDKDKSLSLRFLNRDVVISWPEMEFFYHGSETEVPIQDQVLLLHYLNGAFNSGAGWKAGEWVSFQDLPDGRFYMDAFLKRAKDPLLKTFGTDPKRLVELASRIYDAGPAEYGDISVVIKALPLAPIVLMIWQGDDEFPPDGNILFNQGIAGILSAEDTAWLAGAVVYPLVGMAKGK